MIYYDNICLFQEVVKINPKKQQITIPVNC